MNDYKVLIECLKIRSEYNRDGGFWNEGVSDSIDAAIKAIERLVRERDAAIHDLDMAVCGQESYPCGYCANYGIAPINVDDVCKTCTDCENWEWRGVRDADS